MPSRSEFNDTSTAPQFLCLFSYMGVMAKEKDLGFLCQVRKHFEGLSPIQRARLLMGPLRGRVDPDPGLVIPWRLGSSRRGRKRAMRAG